MLRMLRLVMVFVLLCCFEHLGLIMCSIAGALCKWSCRNQGKCCNQSQVPQPSCGTWWWRSWLRICIFRPLPTCRSPLQTSSFSILNILPKMCRFTNFSRAKQNELGIFYTNNIYKFHVWVEVAMSVLSWFCIYASQLLRHSASLCKLHALKTQFSTNSSRQLRAIEFLPTSSWRWFQVYKNSIMQNMTRNFKEIQHNHNLRNQTS